jgi:hypothetical protein
MANMSVRLNSPTTEIGVAGMAQRVQIVLVDDLDGGGADELVRFALDGVSYEIDLSTSNAARLRDAFTPFVAHARRAAPTGRAKSGSPRRRRELANSGTHAIRLWAKERGREVGERGRVPLSVRVRYDAEHQGS